MTAFNDTIAFCHVPKTAGHSCREYMAEHLTGVRDLEDMYASPPHLAIRDFDAWIGRPASSFETIVAVIRNPFEHQVSQWLFWKDRYARGYRMEACGHAMLHPDLTHWLCDEMADWHVYDQRPTDGRVRSVAPDYGGYEHFGGYYPYWLFVDGSLPDNVKLVRFERLAEDFPKALGLEGSPMPHSNAGPEAMDARPYYSPKAVAIVERKFAWIFEHGLYPRWST